MMATGFEGPEIDGIWRSAGVAGLAILPHHSDKAPRKGAFGNRMLAKGQDWITGRYGRRFLRNMRR